MLSLLVLVGCQTRFSDVRMITFEAPGEISTLIVDAAPRERQLSVEASANYPIGVYVYLEENQDEAERFITLGKESELLIGKAKGATEVDLTATIPTDKTAIVMVVSTKADTNVDLSITD